MKHPPECRELARKLKGDGMTYRAIQRYIWTNMRADVSESRIRAWCQE